MVHFVLAVNATLAAWGQIAAIIIGLYALIFIVIALAFNLGMAYGLAWLREKANLIKLLRPTVVMINETTKAALKGIPPPESENPVVRVIAEGPFYVRTVDEKVTQASSRVSQAIIEFHARTEQAQSMVKAFLSPQKAKLVRGETNLQIGSPGQGKESSEPVVKLDGRQQRAIATQHYDASSH
jgi:hypothetical protein